MAAPVDALRGDNVIGQISVDDGTHPALARLRSRREHPMVIWAFLANSLTATCEFLKQKDSLRYIHRKSA